MNGFFGVGSSFINSLFLGVFLVVDGFTRLMGLIDRGNRRISSFVDVIRIGSGVDSLFTVCDSFVDRISLQLLFSRC